MSSGASLSIVNGLLFDGVSEELVEAPLHLHEGAIASEDELPIGTPELDAEGALVSPGLIDAHFHAYGASLDFLQLEAMPASYVVSHAATRLRNALARGFTTVRDVAGGDLGIVRALDEGLVDGPRYLFTGRAFTQTGGHGDPRPGDLDLCCGSGHMSEVVDGVDDLRRAVRERFRTGSHAIKIFTSGGVVSPTDPLRLCQYSSDEIVAVCDEAARRHSYVVAHAYSPSSILHAVENGVRTIEHGNLLDGESAAAMAEAGAYLVPTLVAYDSMARRGEQLGLSATGLQKNREVLDAGLRSIAIARSAGIAIGFGTDLMGDLEDDQLIEFQIRLQAEGTFEALRSATSVNAEIIGRPDLGCLGLGTPADVVIFDGNPFESPELLWSPRRRVIQNGREISS